MPSINIEQTFSIMAIKTVSFWPHGFGCAYKKMRRRQNHTPDEILS